VINFWFADIRVFVSDLIFLTFAGRIIITAGSGFGSFQIILLSIIDLIVFLEKTIAQT